MLNALNLNQIRIFECVFRNRSVSLAAKELHLTQSGVSQHLIALEDALGLRLFDRIKKRLVPTAAGSHLFEHWSGGLRIFDQAVQQIQGKGKALTGLVRVGVPVEFGNNVILPLVAGFAKKNPAVRFRFHFGLASQINEELLRGGLDFAFVDDFVIDRRIERQKVFDEVLQLVVLRSALKAKPPAAGGKAERAYFEELEYIEYEEEQSVLGLWFEHHLGKKQRPTRLKVRATVMETQAVARLIQSGMGAGVLPAHLAEKLARQGVDLFVFKGSGVPLKNAISLAQAFGKTQSPAAAALIEYLKANTV